MNIADGFDLVVRTAVEAARPDPELRVDEWSEQHMVLPKSGPHPGPFRFERTPYARRVAQVLSPGHPCKRVVARVASQMFKTQIAINWIGACIHQAPGNILALQPTDGLAKRFSARVAMAIRNVPVLRDCVSAEKSRDKRNTSQAKDFKGDATLYINTAGAAANLAEITARYLFIDEVDRLPPLSEGDSVEIAEARATQHERDCKFYEVSSPTDQGFSRIDELHALGTQEYYAVPCPHCGHLHELELDNFRYQRDEDSGYMSRAWFVCPECGAEIEEHQKVQMFPDVEMGGAARWIARSTGDGRPTYCAFSISGESALKSFACTTAVKRLNVGSNASRHDVGEQWMPSTRPSTVAFSPTCFSASLHLIAPSSAVMAARAARSAAPSPIANTSRRIALDPPSLKLL